MHTSLRLILLGLLVGNPLVASALDEPPPTMHQQMQRMQAAFDKAAAANTPAERQAAMQENLKTMKASLAMMHTNCHGMGMSTNKDGMDTGMTNMMMRMLDQQSSMMGMPVSP